MPRTARRESASSIYHVVARGSSHQIIFENSDDRAFFMSRASARIEEAGGELYAWCLMDNHVHMLLRIALDSLSRSMHALLSGYAGYFNRVHGRTGPLFESRFDSEPVESDEYLMNVVRYIHRNPLKENLSDGLSFPWSSYDEYLHGNGWSRHEFVIGVFGCMDEFVRFHEEERDDVVCLDVPSRGRKGLPDAEALRIAEVTLGGQAVGSVKSLPRDERNEAVMMLKHSGLSTRQIQRLTGVSLGTISNAGK